MPCADYLRILDQGWMPQWDVAPGKSQWIVSDVSRFEPRVAKQMMLNSDLCLLFDNSRTPALTVDRTRRGSRRVVAAAAAARNDRHCWCC